MINSLLTHLHIRRWRMDFAGSCTQTLALTECHHYGWVYAQTSIPTILAIGLKFAGFVTPETQLQSGGVSLPFAAMVSERLLPVRPFGGNAMCFSPMRDPQARLSLVWRIRKMVWSTSVWGTMGWQKYSRGMCEVCLCSWSTCVHFLKCSCSPGSQGNLYRLSYLFIFAMEMKKTSAY